MHFFLILKINGVSLHMTRMFFSSPLPFVSPKKGQGPLQSMEGSLITLRENGKLVHWWALCAVTIFLLRSDLSRQRLPLPTLTASSQGSPPLLVSQQSLIQHRGGPELSAHFVTHQSCSPLMTLPFGFCLVDLFVWLLFFRMRRNN